MPSLSEVMQERPDVSAIVMNGALSHRVAARKIEDAGFQTTERSVRRARARATVVKPAPVHTVPQQGLPQVGSGRAEQTSDTITFHNVVFDQNCHDAEDWGPIFKIFGFSEEHFEIVDDTVKISTWQQSKGTDDGQRDFIQLYSHSARFRRISKDRIPAKKVSAWAEAFLQDVPRAAEWATNVGGGTYVVLIADPQLGKKGTEQAIENWRRGVRLHANAVHRLIEVGRAPEAIHLAFQGDETEGVCNNYTNQPHTIELNLTAQLELDFDLRMWTIRQFTEFGIPLSVSSVISNHGEWTRNGSKDVVTTRGDNASTHIARQCQKVFKEIEPFGGPQITWHIGDSDPAVVVELSGVKCYFSHGYIEKGKGASTEIRTKNAMERQILGRTEELADVALFFVAHYHHYYVQEFEGRTLFGLPALEAEKSSEYMRDQYGVWSPPGMLGLLVGADKRRGWSDKNVF